MLESSRREASHLEDVLHNELPHMRSFDRSLLHKRACALRLPVLNLLADVLDALHDADASEVWRALVSTLQSLLQPAAGGFAEQRCAWSRQMFAVKRLRDANEIAHRLCGRIFVNPRLGRLLPAVLVLRYMLFLHRLVIQLCISCTCKCKATWPQFKCLLPTTCRQRKTCCSRVVGQAAGDVQELSVMRLAAQAIASQKCFNHRIDATDVSQSDYVAERAFVVVPDIVKNILFRRLDRPTLTTAPS